MFVDTADGIIFIHVPKTAGESVVAAFADSLGGRAKVIDRDYAASLPGRRRHGAAASLKKHSTALQVRDALGPAAWNASLTFSVVRHPALRVASLYSYLDRVHLQRTTAHPKNLWFSSPLGRSHDPMRWPGMRAYVESDSFESFLAHPSLMSAQAARPQTDYVSDEEGRLVVNEIVHFESLSEGLDRVCRLAGVAPVSLPHRNRSGNRPPVLEMRGEARTRIETLYATDFETFGYEWEQRTSEQ